MVNVWTKERVRVIPRRIISYVFGDPSLQVLERARPALASSYLLVTHYHSSFLWEYIVSPFKQM